MDSNMVFCGIPATSNFVSFPESPCDVAECTYCRFGCVDAGTEANHLSQTANSLTSYLYTGMFSGWKPFITVSASPACFLSAF